MNRGGVLILAILGIVALWAWVRLAEETRLAQEHAARISAANQMVGVAGQVFSYIFG